ncbi:MAG: NPCBM/NEW2 domain-containing protein, partial [Victivallaceae bacterium]|nr:NPCBM/NEW2 domain-containing protein [Victivallaceae bacterium]
SRQAAQIVEFEVFGDKTGQVILPWKLDPSKSFFPSEVLKMRTRLWLSDRPLEMLSAKQDEKTLAYDRECYNGGILQIRGQEFDKGLGIHAKSEIVYRLNPADGWKLFTAYVGIDDCSTPVGTVDFQIWVDGKIVARSGKITMKNQPVPIWANLIGAKELKLVVDDCADGIYGDIADWAEACIRK